MSERLGPCAAFPEKAAITGAGSPRFQSGTCSTPTVNESCELEPQEMQGPSKSGQGLLTCDSPPPKLALTVFGAISSAAHSASGKGPPCKGLHSSRSTVSSEEL